MVREVQLRSAAGLSHVLNIHDVELSASTAPNDMGKPWLYIWLY